MNRHSSLEHTMLGTYFVGVSVVTKQALIHIQKYMEKVTGPIERIEEKHITVLPPFLATYEQASDIVRGCALASIRSTHPMNTTLFALQDLDIMEFGGREFLHFPVAAYSTAPKSWENYVLETRRKLINAGIQFKHPVPEGYRPHITIHSGHHLARDRSIRALVEESRKEAAIYFPAAYLTLYAKYKRGYDILSRDPATE